MPSPYPWFKLPRFSILKIEKEFWILHPILASLLDVCTPALSQEYVYWTSSTINPARRHLKTIIDADREKESQVLWWLNLAGHRKDAPWWSSTGEVPGLARTPHMLQMPLAPHSSHHRAVSTREWYHSPTTAPFPGPRLHTPSSPWPEGLISLVNMAAAHYPSQPDRSQNHPAGL